MFSMGPQELVVLCVIGVLLFGRKLPEVGRSLGKSIVAFKQGLMGTSDDVESLPPDRSPESPRPPERMAAGPKFEEAAMN